MRKRSVLILGISDLEHDSAVALVDGNGPVAAIEEEKLSRSPRTGGIPHLALDYCLQQAGARGSDISLAALASRPKHAWLREQRLRLGLLVSRSGASYGTAAHDGINLDLNQLRLLRGLLGPQMPIVNFEHHLCHAASAHHSSGFDRTLVLTLDESGDMWSGLLSLGEGCDLRILRPLCFPNSLGWVYTRVTELLGFRPHRDEYKTQWLSKEGTPDFVAVFRKLFNRDSEGLPILNLRYFANGSPGGPAFCPEIRKELQVLSSSAPHEGALRAAIARSAQDFLEETVVDLAEVYRKATGASYLCVAGGVFLNVLLVHALEKHTGFAKVFVQPVSGNPGSALGAAYLARKHLSGNLEREPLSNLHLGPEFEPGQIKTVLDNCKVVYRYFPGDQELLAETVRLLQSDKIVAWFQGRLEFGLRALGNRSILASPFAPYVVENLNQYTKQREDFHPFALSVPAETASTFFECTSNCRFLASIGTLKGSALGLERFTFNGSAVRVHVVDRQINSRFWSLLHKFGEGALAPILVNTSFNLFGEPLVCEPREAIRSFYCSGIDALVMGNFLVTK